MDVVILLLRTLFFYGLILLVTKTFTKDRKLTLSDLLVAFMVSELSVLAIDRPTQPLAISFLPIVFLLAIHITLTIVIRQGKSPEPIKKSASLIPRFSDVELGLMEDSVPSVVKRLPLPLILDGKVLDYNLNKLGKTRFWLKNQVQPHGVRRFHEVAYCSIDQNGKIFLDKKKL